MTSISAKIIEAFRNLKSDAVPKEPRPQANQETAGDVSGEYHNNETGGPTEEFENIFIEPEDVKDKEKPKKKYSFGKTKKKKNSPKVNKVNGAKNISMNTQATGNVINIVESPNFRWGNNFVYNLGPTQHKSKTMENDESEEQIEKTNDITLLMECKIKPEHDYINYISQNLGKNWHSFFKRLGYTKGRIETFEIDESKYGVGEARYKLLLDWICNEEDNSLGRLATLLWLEGERQIVKELAIMYISNNRK